MISPLQNPPTSHMSEDVRAFSLKNQQRNLGRKEQDHKKTPERDVFTEANIARGKTSRTAPRVVVFGSFWDNWPSTAATHRLHTSRRFTDFVKHPESQKFVTHEDSRFSASLVRLASSYVHFTMFVGPFFIETEQSCVDLFCRLPPPTKHCGLGMGPNKKTLNNKRQRFAEAPTCIAEFRAKFKIDCTIQLLSRDTPLQMKKPKQSRRTSLSPSPGSTPRAFLLKFSMA